MKIGTTLLKLRKQFKLSQAEVAERLNICQSTYCAWESDRSLPSSKSYVNLAAVFGVTFLELTSCTSSSPGDHTAQQLNKEDNHPFYNDLTVTQKQLITLLQQRIDFLEDENQQLRHQIKYLEKDSGR